MNHTTHAIISLLVLVSTTVATAKDTPSAEQGKKLFNSTSLGTNGKSCATCHPNGKRLDYIADHNEKTLQTLVNGCIVKALKGKSFSDDSPELGSIVMYLNTLNKADPK